MNFLDTSMVTRESFYKYIKNANRIMIFLFAVSA